MDHTPDKLRERARQLVDACDADWSDAVILIASAFAEIRREALEQAIRAVEDAGGDNEDYHADAIRALKDKP